MLIVFDLETIDTNTNKVSHETAIPTQLAAIPLDENSLEIIDDPLCMWINPGEDILGAPDFFKEYSNVLAFHEKAQGKSKEELVELWRSGLATKDAMKEFKDYVKSYTKGSKKAYAAGMNIRNFDLPILERLIDKGWPFAKVKTWDIRDIAQMWFEYSRNPPKLNGRVSYSFDSLRQYFDMSTENAHDALVDVRQEADLLRRFLRLQKNLMTYGYQHRDQKAFAWAKVLHGVKS